MVDLEKKLKEVFDFDSDMILDKIARKLVSEVVRT